MGSMGRTAMLWLLSAASLIGQEKPGDTLAPLRDLAAKRAADWDALAQGLDGRIARLLPCDPRVRGAIDEVSRASEARLASLMEYLRAAAQKATDDSSATRLLIPNQEAFAAVLNTEHAEADAERAGIEAQLLDLGESAKQRTRLEEAQRALADIAGMARQRTLQVLEQAGRSAALTASLLALDQSYQNEQAALQSELEASSLESARWNEYYAARIERAQTECAITGGAGAPDPRSPQRKKQ
jgi:hypothetical protein